MTTRAKIDREIKAIVSAVSSRDSLTIMGNIAISLLRIANAQEAMYDLAIKDMNEAIEESIRSQAEERAEEMAAERSKRSFIGKR